MNNNNKLWKTKTGKEIPVKEMSERHIRHCINHIVKMIQYYKNSTESYRKENIDKMESWSEWITIFGNELVKRKNREMITNE